MTCTLLVDPISRMNSTIEIAELKRFNINIISDLKEMLAVEYDNSPVILLDGFVQTESGISELILYKELIGLNYIFISGDEVLLRQMQRYAKTYTFDTKHIDYNLLLSAVNDDAEAYKPFLVETSNKFASLCKMVLDNPALIDPMLRDMAMFLLGITEDNKRLSRALSELREDYDIVHGMNENKANQLSYLSKLVDDMLRQTVSVNDALSKYSFLCQKDVYRKISLIEHKNRPHILYFKEYSDFLHLTSFIQTIAEVFRRQYDTPVKVLWLLDKNNPNKLKFVPKYYTVFAEGIYNKPAIHISDYMATTSAYEGIMQTLCENQAGTEYLIIVDSKMADDTVVPIAETLRYDLCRSISKMKAFGLLDSRTIVNNDETGRELTWNHFWDYEDLTAEDRFLYLSNRPVVHAIVKSAHREFSLE